MAQRGRRFAPALAIMIFAGSASAQQLNMTRAELVKVQLRAVYPEAMILQPGTKNGNVPIGAEPEGPVRIVFGVPMVGAKSPVKAADLFLETYDEVFGIETPVLKLESDITLADREQWNVTKSVLRYSQSINNIPVEGSDVRVMVVKDKNDPNSRYEVNFAEANLMPIPAGGTTPTLTKAQALERAANIRPTFVNWSEPTLQITQLMPGNAYYGTVLTWAMTGSDSESFDSMRSVVIDAHTGGLVDVREVVPHYSENNKSSYLGPDITGTVTANRTPDWWSDTRVAINPNFASCERFPVNYNQEEVRIEALDATGTVVGTTYTASDGTYSLPNTGAGPFTVRATLGGENWDVVVDFNSTSILMPCEIPYDPASSQIISINAGQSGVDFEFYPDPSPSPWVEIEVAAANAHEAIRLARNYWKDVLGPTETVLDDSFLVAVNFGKQCGAGSPLQGFLVGFPWFRNWVCVDTIVLGESGSAAGALCPNGSTCPNASSQTVAIHEYGHLVATRLLGISHFVYGGFHEGYADSLGFIVLDDAAGGIQPDLMYSDLCGTCGEHARQPLLADPIYPHCGPAHVAGELLGALWIEMRRDITSLSHVRTMFGAWSLIAVPPSVDVDCAPNDADQSAAPNTFIEVLIADDDDGNLNNGTPNFGTICSIFNNRNIYSADYSCTESIGSIDLPDCDESGSLDIFDFLCFSNLFASGDIAADLDDNNVLDTRDYATFQSIYENTTLISKERNR